MTDRRTLLNMGEGLPDMFLNILHGAGSAFSATAGYNFLPLLDENQFPISPPTNVLDTPVFMTRDITKQYVLGLQQGSCAFELLAGTTVISGNSFLHSADTSNITTVKGTQFRIVFTFNALTTAVLTLAARFPATIGSYSSPRGLYLCRLEDEAAYLAATKPDDLWHPNFVAYHATDLNIGKIRAMGQASINEANLLAQKRYYATWNTSLTQYGKYDPDIYAGVLSGTNSYTCSAPAHSLESAGYVDGETILAFNPNSMTYDLPTLSGFSTPSASSVTIGSGNQSFTVASGLPIFSGQLMAAISGADPTNKVVGTVTYSGTALTIAVPAAGVFGSGAHSDWTIYHVGPTLNVGGKGIKEIAPGTFPRRALMAPSVSSSTTNMLANNFCLLVYSEAIDRFLHVNSSRVSRSLSIEMQVGFANRANCDCWLTLPVHMTDDSVSDIIAYVSANLNSNLNCYLAWGNEPWNAAFPTFHTGNAIGERNGWGFGSGEALLTVIGKTLQRWSILADTAWTADRSRLKFVAEWQAAGSPAQVDTSAFQGQSIGSRHTITGITNANPAIVTAPGHDFANGETIRIGGYQISIEYPPVAGMSLSNGASYTVATANVGAGTFALQGFNSTALGTWTSGGSCWRPPVAPNRPGDSAITHASVAWYFYGNKAKQVDSEYVVGANFTTLLGWVDDYATGNPSLMRSALESLHADLLSDGSFSGSLRNFIDVRMPLWNETCVTWNKKMVPYEGGHSFFPISSARCTVLGIDTSYATKMNNFFEAYLTSDLGYILTMAYFDGVMAQSKSEAPGWLQLNGHNGWALIDDDTAWALPNSVTARRQSWYATQDWNNPSEEEIISTQTINQPAGAPTIRRRRAQYDNYDTIARREKIREIEALKAAILARGETAPLAAKVREFIPYKPTMSIRTLVAELARVQQELEDEDEVMKVFALLH